MAKVSASEIQTPRQLAPSSSKDNFASCSSKECQPLQDDGGGGGGGGASQDGVKMQKQLGVWDGIAIIVGIIVGSGIFVSPKGVLMYSGSVGQALIVWVLSGVLSMVGALCYAELGTMIPKSGGDYAYIGTAFGALPSFLYLWVALFVLVPSGNAITALTFAENVLQPAWKDCKPPYVAVRLLAAVITCLLTAINCFNVKWVTRVQDIFTWTKILALIVIVIAGIVHLATGHTENLNDLFEGSQLEPGYVALAFYSGLFSYSGWNYLNFVTEELKDPYKNLPKAICISMPLVTIIYVVANMSYFAVLSRDSILASTAVAVTFGDVTLGFASWLMPFFVACSTFGSLNGAIFASSRLFFVGARNGHLPMAIALIDVKRLTPVPSLIFMCIITLVLLVIRDVYVLINYVSFVEALFILLSVTGLLWLRYKDPHAHRPIKVNIVLPVLFFIICGFLVTLPCYVSTIEVCVGIGIIVSGVPVYFVLIAWKNKPQWLLRLSVEFNLFCARMFLCVPEGSQGLHNE